MKDKKLFGKLNIIDFFVILLLIAVIAAAAWYFLRPKTPETVSTELSKPNVRFSVLCRDVTDEIAENVVAQLEGADRDVDGQKVSPRRIFNSNELLDGEVTQWEILHRDDGTTDLLLTVEGNLKVTGTVVSLGAQEIRVGVSYNVKTIVMEVPGKVASLELLS